MASARLLCIGPPAETAACARAAERAGYRAGQATAKDAVTQLAELHPDAVLLWPDDDTPAILTAIRAAEEPPLLVLVGQAGDATAAGADAVIAQVGDPVLLLAEVDLLLSGHGLIDRDEGTSKDPSASAAPDALSALDQVLDREMQTLWSQLTPVPSPLLDRAPAGLTGPEGGLPPADGSPVQTDGSPLGGGGPDGLAGRGEEGLSP